MDLSVFPKINASLNATSACFLLLGYFLIKQKRIKWHAASMLAAFTASMLFLVSYLFYHYHHRATPFPGQGPVRVVYFTILTSHTLLAIVNLPLVILTLTYAVRGRWGHDGQSVMVSPWVQKHVRLAKITFPIWLYVSVTGVVIYWMLYRTGYSA